MIALAALGMADLDHLLSREGMLEPGGRRRGGGGNAGGRRRGVVLDENTVSEVVDDSPAATAGLKAGDKIIKIDDSDVTDRRSLMRALFAGEPKKKVVFERDGKRMEVTMEWPSQRPRRTEEPAKEEEKKEEEKRGADL